MVLERLPTVDNCCFCLSVEIGAKIFAILFIAVDFSVFMAAAAGLAMLGKLKGAEPSTEDYIDASLAVAGFCVLLVINILLAVGLFLDILLYIRIWLWTTIVVAILLLIVTIVLFVEHLATKQPLSDTAMRVSIVLLTMVVRIYAVIVISSEYHEILAADAELEENN